MIHFDANGLELADPALSRSRRTAKEAGDLGVIEIRATIDLGIHAPGRAGLHGLARALALALKEEAEEVATTSAEASMSEEVHAARPEVEYRVDGSEWLAVSEVDWPE